MNNKVIKLSFFSIILSLALLTASGIIKSHQGQRESLNSVKFSVPLASGLNEFISVWDTNITSADSSGSNQVTLPLHMNGTYNFMMEWGDGNNDTITIWNQTAVTHSYASSGVYTITINGTIIGWQFNNKGDRLKILEIQQWGCLGLGNSESYFYGCSNLQLSATDSLNLTGTTSLYQAFRSCTYLGSSGNLNSWDVSSVTDMSNMFHFSLSFNQPIGSWDVSSVIDMSGMFAYTDSFNQPIDTWDVSSVTDMSVMFANVDSFNQPISNWDVSSVMDMNAMFWDAANFNQPIGTWDVSSVTDMSVMFQFATSFNQPISNWDVSSVTDMSGMFMKAGSFNQPIGVWDVSSVTDMSGMFAYTDSFNQPIGTWDVSSVIDMNNMFYWAPSFNQPIGTWDVSSVTDMSEMFNGVTLSTHNYDNLLIGWSKLSLQHGVIFDGGNSKYSSAAASARQAIIDNFAWIITDGGQVTEISVILSYNLIVFIAVLGVSIILIMRKKQNIKYQN